MKTPPRNHVVKLVLFDIDGTILAGGGAGKRAVTRALVEVFGSAGPTDHRFDGKTDPQIVRELMRLDGHGDPHIDERMPLLLDRYLEFLHEELRVPPHARLLPGVGELLDALESRSDVVLGLLTGNLAGGARAKLAAVGVDPDRFRVGAYGSDHETRGELPAVAQRRTRDDLGIEVRGEDVIVIGDTPNDLQCGQAIGARAIGVATGHYTVDDLLAYRPAAVFRDLRDTAAVIAAILTAGVAPHP